MFVALISTVVAASSRSCKTLISSTWFIFDSFIFNPVCTSSPVVLHPPSYQWALPPPSLLAHLPITRSSVAVSSLTPNRGNRSSSRGANATSTDRTRRRPLAIGQARSASVTPSSSFVAEKPGQVEKALSGSSTLPRRAARSADRRQAPPKPSGSPGEAPAPEAEVLFRFSRGPLNETETNENPF